MKKVVVVGCSSLIVSAAELLNPLEMKVVGLGDTRRRPGTCSRTTAT